MTKIYIKAKEANCSEIQSILVLKKKKKGEWNLDMFRFLYMFRFMYTDRIHKTSRQWFLLAKELGNLYTFARFKNVLRLSLFYYRSLLNKQTENFRKRFLRLKLEIK